MQVLESPHAMIEWRRQQSPEKSVGFVPTMGALHAGHATLLKQARHENDLVVLSIFVNPTQFNDPNDFAKYPKTWEGDVATAKAAGVDAIFAPHRDQMYPDDYHYKVVEDDFSKGLCGKNRPGHFDGVLSVVMKLFNVVSPTRAYFGEKDYQQLSLIKGMVTAFFMPLQIVPVPTVREADGLAMSSRNVRLTPDEREKAPRIYSIIKSAPTAEDAWGLLEREDFRVDYVIDKVGRRFVAVRLGDVRLIDNVELAAK